MLPHWEASLGRIHEIGTGGEGFAPVGCAHGRDESGVTNGQRSDPVNNSKGENGVPFADLLSNLHEHVSSAGMTLVFQSGHVTTLIVIANITREGDGGTCLHARHNVCEICNGNGRVSDINKQHGRR
jgi:hypothetical protein